MTKKTIAVLALLLAAALGLTACGSNDGSGGTTSTAASHNGADVTFAMDMVQHHRGALAMVDLLKGRQDLDPALAQLASRIEAAQAPEIDMMSGWLQTWGEDVPSAGMSGDMEGMDMGSDIPGMMSDQEMTALGALPAARFGDAWLQAMIAHHQGAVQMAATEEGDGRDADAVALAKKIQKDQDSEIATMQQMLG